MTHIHGLVDSAAGNREVDPDLVLAASFQIHFQHGAENHDKQLEVRNEELGVTKII